MVCPKCKSEYEFDEEGLEIELLCDTCMSELGTENIDEVRGRDNMIIEYIREYFSITELTEYHGHNGHGPRFLDRLYYYYFKEDYTKEEFDNLNDSEIQGYMQTLFRNNDIETILQNIDV